MRAPEARGESQQFVTAIPDEGEGLTCCEWNSSCYDHTHVALPKSVIVEFSVQNIFTSFG